MYALHDAAAAALDPIERLILITGNYGSGKTEVAVNWTMHLARQKRWTLAIADLDVVNPYFRCREATVEMEAVGVKVVAPRGEFFHSELPIILPEIRGLIRSEAGVAILDVGGDDVGARVLRSFGGLFAEREMLQVVNAYRPFTDTVDGCLRIQDEIQEASGLAMTGVISNAHLIEETDVDVIARGAELAQEVARRRNLVFRFVTALRPLAGDVARRLGLPVLPIDRLMLKPWEHPGSLPVSKFRPSAS